MKENENNPEVIQYKPVSDDPKLLLQSTLPYMCVQLYPVLTTEVG